MDSPPEAPKYLVVPPEKFEEAYNFNICPYVQGKPGSGDIDYLAWGIVLKLFRDMYPNYHPKINRVELCNNGDDVKGQILHVCIEDLVTGQKTPSIAYPVLSSTNKFVASPTAKDTTDATMRGFVKAIAVFCGLGYRLFTREDIDLLNQEGARNHPKFKALLKIAQLKAEILKKQALPVDFVEPHFGMDLYQINAIGFQLKELLGTKEEVQPAPAATTTTAPISEDQPPYEQWRNPKDAIAWARAEANITEAQATEILMATEPDPETNSKKENFYHKILELKNPAA